MYIRHFLEDEKGDVIIEYLAVILIAVALIAIAVKVGQSVKSKLEAAGSYI